MGSFLEWMLESSLLVLIIIGIRKIFMGKIRYAGIYALWMLVLLRFLIPVNFISTPVSVANIMPDTYSVWKAEEPSGVGGKSADTIGDIQKDKMVGLSMDINPAGKTLKKQQPKNVLIQQDNNSMQGNVHEATVNTRETKWRVFGGVWIAVSVVLFLWLLLSNVSLLRKIKRSRVLYEERGKIKIYATYAVKTPCLYGFICPAIYLPAPLVLDAGEGKTDREELEQMITHEYVHYRHRDHIWAIFRMILMSVYWFDPFMWLAASCSKKDAELFCDETVIHILGEEKRFCYGEMLVKLAGYGHLGDFRYSMMPMSKKGKEMERRIRAIGEKKHYSKWILLPLAIILSVTIGVTCSSGTGISKEEKKLEEDKGKEGTTGEVSGKQTSERNAGLPGTQTAKAMIPASDDAVAEKLSNYSDFLKDFVQTSGELYTAPTTVKAIVYADTPKEAFSNYIEVFTEAVNMGNTDNMNQVLAEGSEVYVQQCDLIMNYYKRGIREEIKSYSVSAVSKTDTGSVEIYSKEKIKVDYADNTSKIIKQKYCYTCERIDGRWLITQMKEAA